MEKPFSFNDLAGEAPKGPRRQVVDL